MTSYQVQQLKIGLVDVDGCFYYVYENLNFRYLLAVLLIQTKFHFDTDTDKTFHSAHGSGLDYLIPILTSSKRYCT